MMSADHNLVLDHCDCRRVSLRVTTQTLAVAIRVNHEICHLNHEATEIPY